MTKGTYICPDCNKIQKDAWIRNNYSYVEPDNETWAAYCPKCDSQITSEVFSKLDE